MSFPLIKNDCNILNRIYLKFCQFKEFRIQESEYRMKRQLAKDFQDLVAWKKSHQCVLSIYRYTASFPQSDFSQRFRLRGDITANDTTRRSEQTLRGISPFNSEFWLLTSGF